MNVIDVMVDLETMGTTPGSVVLSVGAVCASASFIGRIDMRDSLFLGLTVNPDTMSWWRKQSADAWAATQLDAEPTGLVLQDFASWLLDLRAQGEGATGTKLRLWGDSASFDLGLLAAAYRAAQVNIPWSYHEEYCYRTLRNVLGSEKPRAKLQHDALSDARAQLEHLQEMLGRIAK